MPGRIHTNYSTTTKPWSWLPNIAVILHVICSENKFKFFFQKIFENLMPMSTYCQCSKNRQSSVKLQLFFRLSECLKLIHHCLKSHTCMLIFGHQMSKPINCEHHNVQQLFTFFFFVLNGHMKADNRPRQLTFPPILQIVPGDDAESSVSSKMNLFTQQHKYRCILIFLMIAPDVTYSAYCRFEYGTKDCTTMVAQLLDCIGTVYLRQM